MTRVEISFNCEAFIENAIGRSCAMRRRSLFEIECLCGRPFSLDRPGELGCLKCHRILVVIWEPLPLSLVGSQESVTS